MIDDTRLPDGPVLVSGLPRSGTSMMMKMISNGGLSVLSDGVRVADVDNPETETKREHISRSVEIKVEDIDLGSQTGEL